MAGWVCHAWMRARPRAAVITSSTLPALWGAKHAGGLVCLAPPRLPRPYPKPLAPPLRRQGRGAGGRPVCAGARAPLPPAAAGHRKQHRPGAAAGPPRRRAAREHAGGVAGGSGRGGGGALLAVCAVDLRPPSLPSASHRTTTLPLSLPAAPEPAPHARDLSRLQAPPGGAGADKTAFTWRRQA